MVVDRRITFANTTLIQALNGDTFGGQFACILRSGLPIVADVEYNVVSDFLNCSTVNGGFRSNSFSTTVGQTSLYFIAGYNGACGVFYGPLPDSVDSADTLQSDPLSVGGKVFIRIGEPGCEFGVNCFDIPVTPGVCDSTLTQANANVAFAPLQFSVTDPDGIGNSQFSFSILSGNDGGFFAINSATGVLRLIRALDRDIGETNYTLLIGVSDGLFSNTFEVFIAIEDRNDNPPMPTRDPITASVDEGAVAPMEVISFRFTDGDDGANAEIMYSLTGADGNFAIRSPTIGSIFRERDFDYDTGDRFFNFTVVAVDGGSPSLTGRAQVEITVNDINDNLPTIVVEGVPNVAFVEGQDPISPASVSVMDADSDNFPLLYAVVRIYSAPNANNEILSLNTSLPSGFRIGYYNNTLVIVGAGDPNLYSSLLSQVTYENIAVLFETPLERSLIYGVCDQLIDDTILSRLSPGTRLSLTSAGSSDSDLPVEDFELLLSSCFELVVDNTSLALVETNDRPFLLNVTIEFPDIREDQSAGSSMGSCVGELFAQTTVDVDRDPFVGIAIVGHGSPAQGQAGVMDSSNECWTMYNNYRSDPNSVCGNDGLLVCNPGDSLICFVYPTLARVAFKCTRPNNHISISSCNTMSQGRKKRQTIPNTNNSVIVLPDSEITRAEFYPGIGGPIDITPVFTGDIFTFNTQLESYQQQCNFLSSNGSYYSYTFMDGSTLEVATPSIDYMYTNIASVNESSAIVLGPSAFIRWIPFENQVGTAYLTYKAWDGSNGLISGTSGVDTTNERDTSFSLEIGNATVEVLAVNDAPIIELGGPGQLNYTTTYNEGGPSVFVADRNAAVIEFDRSDLTLFDLRVSISALGGDCDLPTYNGDSNDRLTYFNDTEIPLTYNMSQIGQACVEYLFEGEMSIDQWRAFITTIRFRTENVEPSDHTRQISFTIGDSMLVSNPSYTFVDVRLVSDMCPILTLPGSSPITHTEHGGPTVLDAGIILTDNDRDPFISSASVSILPTTNNPCTSCELSAATDSTGISASFNSSTLVLTLSGTARPEDYQQVLRTVAFEDTGLEPSFKLVEISFFVFDPTVTPCTSAMGDLSVMVEHVNDNSPELYLAFPLNQDYTAVFTEGGGPVMVTGAEVSIVDADGLASNLYSIILEIAQGCIPAEDRLVVDMLTTVSVPYDSSSCSLTLEGNITELEADLPRMRYNNLNIDNPTTTQRILNFTIIDGTLESTSAETILSIVAINNPPVIDLDIQNPVSSDSMATLILGTTSVSIAPGGATIEDPDNTNLVMMVLTVTEVDSNGNEISSRSDSFFESIGSSDPNLPLSFGLVFTYTTATGIANIAGIASVSNYVAVLNDILYSNIRLPPTENNRRIRVQVSDGVSNSAVAVANIRFAGQLTPPILDLNGNEPGVNAQATYVITTPPLVLFPNTFLTDMDGDNICTVNVTLSGPNSTCFASSVNFESAFSDIVVSVSEIDGGAVYGLSTLFADCRETIVFQSVIRGITFSLPASANPGTCQIDVYVTDARSTVSNTASGSVEVRAFNAAPFIDLDLGLYGRDYSTVYFQGGRLQHIVSIYDPATARNITDMTVIGEADGEAPFDDGTIYHGVVLQEESNAGYTLMDTDSPFLDYLQVSKVCFCVENFNLLIPLAY